MMYKALIFKNFEVISDHPCNLSELKNRYSFLQSKTFINKKARIFINQSTFINYKSQVSKKDGFSFKKKRTEIIIIFNNKFAKIKDSIFDYKIKICTDKNFPRIELINLIDDLIIIKLIQSKFIPIHASGFYFKKKGILLASYGGTGKTRLILEANRYYSKCKFFDEWCLLKKKIVTPLRKEILLMPYDILSFKTAFGLIDCFRAYISTIFKSKTLREFLRIIRLSLPYKYKYFKNVDFFKLNYVFFIKQGNNKKIYINKVAKEKISNQITKNFFYEKKRLLSLVLTNNSVLKFKNKIPLFKFYKNLLNQNLNFQTYKNILINRYKKNFTQILKEIVAND